MLSGLCGFRRLGLGAAVTVSIIGSIVLIHELVTPNSVRLLRTPELIAVLALFVLPALTLATMRRAWLVRPPPPPSPADQSAGLRRSHHEPATPEGADRAERHRRRGQGVAKI